MDSLVAVIGLDLAVGIPIVLVVAGGGVLAVVLGRRPRREMPPWSGEAGEDSESTETAAPASGGPAPGVSPPEGDGSGAPERAPLERGVAPEGTGGAAGGGPDVPVGEEVEVPAPEVLADDGGLSVSPTGPRQGVEPGAVAAGEVPAGEPISGALRLRRRLARARASLAGRLAGTRRRRQVDDALFEELEETLILADVGVQTTSRLLDGLRQRVAAGELRTPDDVVEGLRDAVGEVLAGRDRTLDRGAGPATVWLFVGVNGVGKTTTIGKVAAAEREAGRSVLLAAADTFRAAAGDQLALWGERARVEVVRGAEGGDPAAVVFDAVQRAAARGIDLVLADTAGRLHTKTNLMAELEKVRRVAARPPADLREVLLVLDATTGQNGLAQARVFTDAVQVTGVVLTKLDGSAKGGIVIAVEAELGVPVKLVGVGEGVDDLVPFDPVAFVGAVLGRGEDETGGIRRGDGPLAATETSDVARA